MLSSFCAFIISTKTVVKKKGQMVEYLFIVLYYRQLSADLGLKPVLLDPRVRRSELTKLVLILILI